MEIIGYPNYLIHRDGRVWSKHRNRFLKISLDTKGYYKTVIFNENKQKTFRIHRLIAQYYISNPNNLPYVDHINGNKQDNRIENLRWVTKQDNNRNRTICRSNTGYQGVSFCKRRNDFMACYAIQSKCYKKKFKTLEEAVVWRKEMVDKYYNRPQSS